MSPHQPRISYARIAVLALGLLALLAACNLPDPENREVTGAGAIYTAAARTVSVQLTEINRPPATSGVTPAPPPTRTLPPSPEPASPTPPAATLTVTAPPIPLTGPTAVASCDQARFIGDVTYPDGSRVSPGETFVKTWRLENGGSCTWTEDYALVFSGGELMGAPAQVPLPHAVAPGERVDVSVTFTAPQAVGGYRSEWLLYNASRQLFGVGVNFRPVWAQINVAAASGVVYDFIARAAAAEWASGVGEDFSSPLDFSGNLDDRQGAAAVQDRAPLENGATSGKLLVTVPRQERDGSVRGIFPEYTVQPGDRLKVRLGFLIPAGECEGGDAIFEIGYVERGGSQVRSLERRRTACDGRLDAVDLDLSALAGETVSFVFTVYANGPFQGDYAVWNSALIEH